jgi:hypothetical protein
MPLLLLLATMPEVSGDAVVRVALYNSVGISRLALPCAGALLLLGCGLFLNTAPQQSPPPVGHATDTG